MRFIGYLPQQSGCFLSNINRIASFLVLLIVLSACAPLQEKSQANKLIAIQPETGSIHFSTSKLPLTDIDKRAVLSSQSVIVNGQTYPIDYHTILRSGDKRGDSTFGLLLNEQGQAIKDKTGKPLISSRNDFTSLLTVEDEIFMVSQFEDKPGVMYLAKIAQDKKTGLLNAVDLSPLDFKDVNGGWVHCAGSITPWNSHLGTEEYEPDADLWNSETGALNKNFKAMAAYFGGDIKSMHPYHYGWIIEVKVLNKQGDTQIDKHYSMGRFSHELAYVLPDSRTAYMSDDGSNVGLYMFFADKAGDMTAGHLYAAHWLQTGSKNGGQANIEWIDLGHASNTEVKNLINKNLHFDDIFEKASVQQDNSCPTGFSSINTGSKPHSDKKYHECLKLKKGMEVAASRLETRRYAAMLGATTEFNKEEGISFDAATNTLYIGMSYIEKGMENNQKYGKFDNTYDIGGDNHINIPFNRCGGVYALDLKKENQIGSDYVATTMRGFLMGKMTQAYDKKNDLEAYPENSLLVNNYCDVEGLANPDNISIIPGYNTLIVGEDTNKGHQNDAVWSLNLKTKKLTRILTTPYGSEITSPYVIPNLNGFAYIMGVVQHPYGETDKDKLNMPQEKQGYTGYIGPLPALSD
jgi:secreted PhoX family phosphatase